MPNRPDSPMDRPDRWSDHFGKETHSLSASCSGDANYATINATATTVRIGFKVAGDFDGDGRADLLIYDAALAESFAQESGGGSLAMPFGTKGHANKPA